MSKVVVLGGCGAVGSVSVRTLSKIKDFSRIVIADINMEKANAMVQEIGADHVEAVHVDALDIDSVKNAIRGADIVLNTTGPFYRYVPIILKAVIEEKINYIDVCDDVDVTLDILKMDEQAKAAGIAAVIGLGSSPGVTNLLAKFAAESLLQEVESIDIYHAHGGEPIEGPGVIGHRFHCMSIDVPQFIDGELKQVKFFEPEGIALQELVDFQRLGTGIRVYPYPHPEQVTIPNYIKARRVTNKGTVLPDEYYELTKDICRLGLHRKEPVMVKGQPVSPYDFAVAYILEKREEILKQTNFGTQRGCVKVVVAGKKEGKPHSYVFSMASEGEALGEGTGIPAAFGVVLMHRGKIKGKGVMPPEACITPMDFIQLIPEIVKPEKGKKSFEGLLIESIDENGEVKTMSM